MAGALTKLFPCAIFVLLGPNCWCFLHHQFNEEGEGGGGGGRGRREEERGVGVALEIENACMLACADV